MRWVGIFLGLSLVVGPGGAAWAHSVQHQVETRALTVARVFYDADDPAPYAPFEVFAPGTTEAHATGRTDRHGFLCFVPDRPGVWKVKVAAESEHGVHGSGFEVTIDTSLRVADFEKPLVATHLKLVIGVTLILSVVALAARRPRRQSLTQAPAPQEVAGP